MKRFIALLLVVGVLLTDALTVLAVIPDPGCSNSNTFIQNIGTSDADVGVTFTTGGTSSAAWFYDMGGAIQSKRSKYLLYSQFGGSIGNGWSGAMHAWSTEPLAVVVNVFWENAGSGVKTAASYNCADNPTTEVHLPHLLKADGYQTRLSIQNTANEDASVTIQFYHAGGGAAGTKNVTVPARSEVTYRLNEVPEATFNGYGSARVTANKRITAVATLHWSDKSAGYRALSAGSTTIWAPGVFRRCVGGVCNGSNWEHWDEVIVKNLGGQTANLHIKFRNVNGSIQYQMYPTIAPGATASYNTQTIPLGSDYWQGTMEIICTNGQPLAGVRVYYPVATVPDNVATTTIRQSEVTAPGKALAFPAVYRKLTGGADEQWSTALVHNVTDTAGTLEIRFFKTDQTEVAGARCTVSIQPRGLARLNIKQQVDIPQQYLDALGTYFSGSMWITPSSGVQVVGVSHTMFTGSARGSGYEGFPVP